MTHEDNNANPPASIRYRGPQGLGEAAAAALGASDATGESLGGLAQEERLRTWAETAGYVVSDFQWYLHKLVSNATAENEVRYRAEDHRAIKRTWPGTFGFVPKKMGGKWLPHPATPLEYLHRLHLQNQLFNDDIRVEGIMISDGPSMIIGQASGGISLITSQRWLDAANANSPHPSETEITVFMNLLGFSHLISSLFAWESDDGHYIVLDAKPDNFILTVAGLLPIDLVICETLC